MLRNETVYGNIFESSEKDYFLDNLWICQKDSGLCIFEKSFNDNIFKLQYSSDIISGFFTAITIFSNQTFSDQLQSIEFNNFKICFKFTQDLLFIVCFNKKKDLSKSKMNRIMRMIVKKFYFYLGSKLTQFSTKMKIQDFTIFSKCLDVIAKNNKTVKEFFFYHNPIKV